MHGGKRCWRITHFRSVTTACSLPRCNCFWWLSERRRLQGCLQCVLGLVGSWTGGVKSGKPICDTGDFAGRALQKDTSLHYRNRSLSCVEWCSTCFHPLLFLIYQRPRSGGGLQAGTRLFVAAARISFSNSSFISGLGYLLVFYFLCGCFVLFGGFFLICTVSFVFWITVLRFFPVPCGDTALEKNY